MELKLKQQNQEESHSIDSFRQKFNPATILPSEIKEIKGGFLGYLLVEQLGQYIVDTWNDFNDGP